MISFENYSDHLISNANVTVASQSPKVDILFIGSKRGDFYLYRLPITLIWKRNERSERAVTAVAWHTDGFIFAVGFESGCIKLFPVQHSVCLHTIRLTDPITCLRWDACELASADASCDGKEDAFHSIDSLYLNSLYQDEVKKFQEVLKLSHKSTMLYGMSTNKLFFLSDGLFLLGSINLAFIKIDSNNVYDIILNREFDQISLLAGHKEAHNEVKMIQHEFSCSFVRTNLDSIRQFTNKFIKILYLEMVIEIQVQELQENWDDFMGYFNSFLQQLAKLDLFSDEEDYCLKSNILELVLFSDCQTEFWKDLYKLMNRQDTQQLINKVNMIKHQPLDSFLFNLMLSLIQLSFYNNQLLNLTSSNLDWEHIYLSRSELLELTRISAFSIMKLHELQKIMKEVNNDIYHFLTWFNFKSRLHSQNEEEIRANTPKIAEMDEYIPKIVKFVTEKLEKAPDNNTYRVKMMHHYIETDLESSLPYITKNMANIDLSSTINTVIDAVNSSFHDASQLQSHYSINGWFNMEPEISLYQLFNTSYKSVMNKIVSRKTDSSINPFLISETISVPTFIGSVILEPESASTTKNALVCRKCNRDQSSLSIAYYDADNQSIVWVHRNNDVTQAVSLILDHIDEGQVVQRVVTMDFFIPQLLICLLTTSQLSSTMSNNSSVSNMNSYLLLLNWGDISDVFKTPVSPYNMNLKESVGARPFTSNLGCPSPISLLSADVFGNSVTLSAVSSALRTEHLPRGAKTMIINNDRGTIVVFFGKSYEKCRVFILKN